MARTRSAAARLEEEEQQEEEPTQQAAGTPATSAESEPDQGFMRRIEEMFRQNNDNMKDMVNMMHTLVERHEQRPASPIGEPTRRPYAEVRNPERVNSPSSLFGRTARRGPSPRGPLLTTPPEEQRLDRGGEQRRRQPETIPIGTPQRSRLPIPIDDPFGSDMDDDPFEEFQRRNPHGMRNPRRGNDHDRDRNWDRERRDRGVKLRLKFPKYQGGDPLNWVYQAERFFRYDGTEEDQKVLIASFHLEETALRWFQAADKAHPFNNWEEFSTAICRRFGPTEYDDFQAMLSKIIQKTSVRAYQEEFERISNRVEGWSDSAMKSVYLSGLRPDIQAEVRTLRPQTLEETFALALMVEEKIKASRTMTRSSWTNPRVGQTSGQSKAGAAATNAKPRPPLRLSDDVKRAARPPTRTLTQAQIEERRAKGLCFRCDEKFTPGHRCARAGGTVMLIDSLEDEEAEEDDEAVDDEPEDQETEEEEVPPQISLHAYSGSVAPKTLRVDGLIKKRVVHILIDTGSTHNFLDERLVKQIGLVAEPTSGFDVALGDGAMLKAESICKGITLTIQGNQFKLDVYPLALRGADLVLGTQWLQSLGPVTFDFAEMWVTFRRSGRRVRLDGNRPNQGAALQPLVGFPDAGTHSYLLQLAPTATESTIRTGMPTDLEVLLQEFADLFEEPHGLPPEREHDHRIEIVPGAGPANVRPYRYPHVQKEEISKMVREMLESGIIQPSRSAYSSPVLLVRKKDGTWRFCVDYRALNAITVKDRYPIPVIEELLDELAGAAHFSKLDLRAGYHQIRVRSEDVHKTAFRTHDGHYEFRVMPFGLTNAPSTFQGLMNDLFRPLLRRYVLVFFDDILIYSRSWQEHLEHLAQVLEILRRNQLKLKQSKCLWGQPKVEYLGHVISAAGVEADQSKIRCMIDWPLPKTPKELRGFLGLTGYYRRFVEGYGKIAAPLTLLLRKGEFKWSETATEAFIRLKEAMTTAPVLALPDFAKPFIIECDASGAGLGAVLMQEGRPIAYMSKALSPRTRSLSTYEREMMAIIHAVTKWRPYLIGRRFTVRTDQQSLPYFLEQRIHTPSQQRWVSKLLGYDYELVYKKGAENRVADALSRQPEPAELALLSSPTFPFLSALRTATTADPDLVQVQMELDADPSSHPDLENRF